MGYEQALENLGPVVHDPAQRRSAALTVAEYYSDDPQARLETLQMLGLDNVRSEVNA